MTLPILRWIAGVWYVAKGVARGMIRALRDPDKLKRQIHAVDYCDDCERPESSHICERHAKMMLENLNPREVEMEAEE